MRNSFRRTVCLAAAVMALAIAACGRADTLHDSTTAEDTMTEGITTEEMTEGTTTEEAATEAVTESPVLRIGVIESVSGELGAYGKNAAEAIRIAVDEINAAGGINGYMLEFYLKDDESDAEKSVLAYHELKEQGVQMIFGGITSDICIAVAEETKSDNVFQFIPSCVIEECAKYPNVFQLYLTNSAQGAANARCIGKNNLADKVAVIYDTSTVYSMDIYEGFLREAANWNFQIVAVEGFTNTKEQDFFVPLQKFEEAGAELVFFPIYYKAAALLLTQADSMEYVPIFFGIDDLNGILNTQDFDWRLAEGVMLSAPYAVDAADELTVHFVTTYIQRCGTLPDRFAVEAYDGMYALKAALEECGAAPDMNASDICAALEKAMLEISIDGLTGFDITWNEAGEAAKTPRMAKIVKGVYINME